MGNNPTKQNYINPKDRPKKNVHWKTAEPPSPPSKPLLLSTSDATPDVVLLKWEIPRTDGGSAILGYFIEHRRTGSPNWIRATPTVIAQPELSLSGLEPGWRYQFRVIAANVVGPSEPSEVSDTLTVTLQRNAVTTPRFDAELQDQTAVENEQVIFQVGIVGVPPPQISWFKDGFEVFSSRRTKIINENNRSTLIIHQAALMDEGEIKCSATNRAGHIVTRAMLKLEAPPKIRLPRQYEDGLLIEADEVIRLKVAVAGRPFPTIVWSHNGEVISNGGRYEILNDDKSTSLKIARAQRSDRGEYNLRAVNKIGDDSVSFLLTVTAKPSAPGRITISTSIGKSVTLTWTEPDDDGGCKIGNYIVEYFRIGWNVWLKAVATRQLTATLNDLIEGSEYKFRVKAESPYGLSDPSVESTVLFIPDARRGIIKPAVDAMTNTEFNKNQMIVVPPTRKLSPARIASQTSDTKKLNEIRQTNNNLQTIVKMLDAESAVAHEMNYGSTGSGRTTAEKKNMHDKETISTSNKDNYEGKEKIVRNDIKNDKTQYQLNIPGDTTDEVHTSNEFMLVLYDDDKNSRRNNDQKHKEIESDSEDELNIPPPLSLSAPELGSELPVPPLMRHCISSTELLFEKAMQRVYQTMQMEEAAEMAAKRRSTSIAQQSHERLTPSATAVKRKLSLTNGTDASNTSSRRNSFRRKTSDELLPSLLPTKTEEIPQFTINQEPINSKNEIRKHYKETAETTIQNDHDQHEEERDLKKEIIDSQRRISLYRHQTPPSSLEFADDYTDSTASSASSLDSLEKFIATVKTMANTNDADELETYHPRMEPTVISHQSNLSIQRDAQIIMPYKNSGFHEIEQRETTNNSASNSSTKLQQPELSNTSSNSNESVIERSRALSPYRQPDSDQSTVELNKPHPLPDPDFVPKPILKRPNSPDPLPPTVEPPIQPVCEKEKPNKSERKGGIMQFFTSKKSSSNNSLTSSQDKLKTTDKPTETLTKSQQARKSMIERRQSSIEENKVMIDHYSDIVKEVSSTHMPPKKSIYLSNSAMVNDAAEERANGSDSSSNQTSTAIKDSGKTNRLSSTMSSNDGINVAKGIKSNESYSRSIFAIKLSKDPKKAHLDDVKPKIETQFSIESDANTSKQPVTYSSEKTPPLTIPSEEIPNKTIEKTRSRPAEATTSTPSKRKPLKPRDRSSSAVRVKSQPTKEKSIEQESNTVKSTILRTQTQAKRLRSESKSPATKNRKALLVQSKAVSLTSADTDGCGSPTPRCQTPEEILEETSTKVKSTMNYITDVAIFCVACWVYMFKDARLALPIVALMIYRQLIAALKEKCPKWIKWKRD